MIPVGCVAKLQLLEGGVPLFLCCDRLNGTIDALSEHQIQSINNINLVDSWDIFSEDVAMLLRPGMVPDFQ